MSVNVPNSQPAHETIPRFIELAVSSLEGGDKRGAYLLTILSALLAKTSFPSTELPGMVARLEPIRERLTRADCGAESQLLWSALTTLRSRIVTQVGSNPRDTAQDASSEVLPLSQAG